MSEKKFLVCGLGKVGIAVADTLDKMYYDVVAIDIDESVVANIRQNNDYRFMCYVADARNLQFVDTLRAVEDFNVAVVVIGDFLTRMLCTKIIKKHAEAVGRNIEVIAWAGNKLEESMLWDLGARRFIRIEENLGKYLAYTASCNDVLDFNSIRLEETKGIDKVDVDKLENAYACMTISVPKSFKGNTIADFIKEYMDNTQKICGYYCPSANDPAKIPTFCDTPDFKTSILHQGDTLIICGYNESLKKLLRNIGD